jgi:uncharacterized membrane protein YgdD (TMEM256/DUF423 family)
MAEIECYLYGMTRTSILAGSIFAALAVIMGAFGAHALELHAQNGELTPHDLDVWDTASRYQFYHALALLAVGIFAKVSGESKSLKAAMWLFIVGVVFFSGSLYLLSTAALTGIGTGAIGPVTPIGGLLFISGWICLVMAALRRNSTT